MKSNIENFNSSVKDIPVLYLLYILAMPLALIFSKLKWKPNNITTLSNISAIVSFYFIIGSYNYWLFIFFWILALFLDMCDGIVARMTNQKSANGSFYDHFTDQIKILVLFLSIGIYYNTKELWILSFLSSTLFLLYAYLSNMLALRKKMLPISEPINKPIKRVHFFKKYIYNNIFLIQGNFVVYLSFILTNNITIPMFYIIIFIILFNLLNTVRYMINTNNQIMEQKLQWK